MMAHARPFQTALQRIRMLHRDEAGPVALLVGLALIPLMAGLGLILDGGLVFYFDRAARNAADAAALAATRELWIANDVSTVATQVSLTCDVGGGTDPRILNPQTVDALSTRKAADVACAVATSAPYNYDPSQVAVNMPPVVSSIFGGAVKHVEVVITRPYSTMIMRLVGQDQVTIRRRAVGGAAPITTTYAIYALSPTDSSPCPTMNIGSNADLTVTGGGVVVNSNCDGTPQSALDVDSGADVTIGGPLDVVGDCDIGGTVTPPCTDLGSPVPDPLSGEPEVVHHHTSGGGDCAYPNTPPAAPCLIDFGDINPLVDLVKDAHLAPVADGRYNFKYDLYPGLLGPDGTEDDTGAFNIGGSRWLVTPKYIAGCGPGELCASQTLPKRFDTCEAPLNLITGKHEMYPGVYWGGFERDGAACEVEFKPGVYVIAGKGSNSPNFESILLRGGPGSPITGTNVLFYITEAPEAGQRRPFNAVIIHNSAGGNVNLSAGSALCPYNGPSFEGIFLFVDRRFDNGTVPYATSLTGSPANRVDVGGGNDSTVTINGTFYDPTGLFIANGSLDLSNAQLIFWLVNFGTARTVNVSCDPGGTSEGLLAPRLRE